MRHSALFKSMKMTSAVLGITTSPVEVINISKHGLWLLLEDKGRFLPFSESPWFRDAAAGKILHIELPSPDHFYWPESDVDLVVESVQ